MTQKMDYSLLRQVLIGVVCKYTPDDERFRFTQPGERQAKKVGLIRGNTGGARPHIKCKTGSASKFHLHSNEASAAQESIGERARIREKLKNPRQQETAEKTIGHNNKSQRLCPFSTRKYLSRKSIRVELYYDQRQS